MPCGRAHGRVGLRRVVFTPDRAPSLPSDVMPGLALGKGLVDLHGGCLSLELVLGHGTTARMFLPASPYR